MYGAFMREWVIEKAKIADKAVLLGMLNQKIVIWSLQSEVECEMKSLLEDDDYRRLIGILIVKYLKKWIL